MRSDERGPVVIKNRFQLTLRGSREAGLSLVEVIIAIALIMIVATATANLSIQAINTASAQERRQLAVTIASSTLENATALPPSTLYNGRWITAVTTAFPTTSTFPGTPATYRKGDPTATSSTPASAQVVKIGPTIVNQSGTDYTLKTLVGPCYIKIQQPATGDCGLASGYSSLTSPPPSTTAAPDPSGYVGMVRVIVVVTWTAGKSCGVSPCSYTASTLIDAHADPTWIIH
jgi:Tfp pilus assembly protein PilV